MIIFELIKASLWEARVLTITQSVYEEFCTHAISCLPASVLSLLDMTPELRKVWQANILQHISFNTNSRFYQASLPISVPYVILKGTSAAQYYPHPEYRTMGDIDIMTRREDFDTACKQLVDNGYHIVSEIYKEAHLTKHGIHIDLHQQFASLNNPDYVKNLDDLIIENINPSHVLPDPVNGLVLLQHINQHLEGGLGLRQIIDWMMFVHKCLPDEKWPEFRELAANIGLEKLAIAMTRMCEIYIGLPERSWCAGADEKLCEQFMEYILACGNFGRKRAGDASVTENVFARSRNPKAAFKLLQERGLVNWDAARKYRALRPFAWLYQLGRYVLRGIRRDKAAGKLRKEYRAARQRNAMLDQLGVKQASKGLVAYKDGKYVKI